MNKPHGIHMDILMDFCIPGLFLWSVQLMHGLAEWLLEHLHII